LTREFERAFGRCRIARADAPLDRGPPGRTTERAVAAICVSIGLRGIGPLTSSGDPPADPELRAWARPYRAS
jgi:hypothetical protein